MEPRHIERKLTAILSADVKGYSRLMGEDEVGTVHTLNACREVIDTLIAQHRGRGDGVNVAARLQSLADAGGIFISGTVYDQVENKLALTYEYLGEQMVKNIVKPVRVWRMVLEIPSPARGEGTLSPEVVSDHF